MSMSTDSVERPTPLTGSGLLLSSALVLGAFLVSLALPIHQAPKQQAVVEPGEVTVVAHAMSEDRTVTGASSSPAAADHGALADYSSSRWGLGAREASKFVTSAATAAARESVDLLLVLAVIAKESSFVHLGNAGDLTRRAISETTTDVDPLRPHGPMQVSGRWHPEKMPTDHAGRVRATTLTENIAAGTRVLREYLAREGGDLTRALQRYNGNLRDARARYASHVLRMREELRDAVQDSPGT